MTGTEPNTSLPVGAAIPEGALPGRPRAARLLAEGVATALAQPVVTAVAALITAAACATVFATAGQAAAAEARVLAEVDQAGARTVVFSDPGGDAGLTAEGLDAIAELPGVEWVVGIGHAADVYNTALGSAGNPVPSRSLYTGLPPVLDLTGGRTPKVGEAIAGEIAIRELGMSAGVGGVSGQTFDGPIVGTFSAADPLADLNRGVLVVTSPSPDEPLRSLHVAAWSASDVTPLEDAVPALLHMTDRTRLRVDSPAVLVDLQRVVAGELGENSRRLMLVALGAGLVFLAVTLYGATVARRRDFGRRRALGASRSAIVVLVLSHTAIAGVVGALVGTGTGLVLVHLLQGNQPTFSFTAGVPVLAVLVALLASVPPALAAALRDPVTILRVP